jgi:hypothetical protein
MDSPGVRRFFYQLRGVSQACLVEATDNNIYIIKMAGAVGPNVLFNEAFGSELLRYFGLPVPSWTALSLSEDFIDLHPEMLSDRPQQFVSVNNTLHFGSRLAASHGVAGTYQIIPSKWASHVVNSGDFVGALAIDIWASHTDSRQVIYSPCGRKGLLTATFIDNSHMFGGPEGRTRACPCAPMIPDLSFYWGLPVDSLLRHWEARIAAVNVTALRSMLCSIPQEWYSPAMAERALAEMESRRRELPSLFDRARATIDQKEPCVEVTRCISSIAPRSKMQAVPA